MGNGGIDGEVRVASGHNGWISSGINKVHSIQSNSFFFVWLEAVVKWFIRFMSLKYCNSKTVVSYWQKQKQIPAEAYLGQGIFGKFGLYKWLPLVGHVVGRSPCRWNLQCMKYNHFIQWFLLTPALVFFTFFCISLRTAVTEPPLSSCRRQIMSRPDVNLSPRHHIILPQIK